MVTYRIFFDKDNHIIISGYPRIVKKKVPHFNKAFLINLLMVYKLDRSYHINSDPIQLLKLKIGKDHHPSLVEVNYLNSNDYFISFDILYPKSINEKYLLQLSYNYTNKLLDEVDNINSINIDKENRRAYIEDSKIIKDYSKDDRYKNSPLLTNLDLYIDLINYMKISFENDNTSNNIYKLKSFSIRDYSFKNRDNEDILYKKIIVKIYKSTNLQIKFLDGNNTFSLILDELTIQNIKDRLDRYKVITTKKHKKDKFVKEID